MSRIRTVFDVDTQTQTDIPFTAEEEAERDEQEAQEAIYVIQLAEWQAKKDALEAKLANDSITFDEMKELMRIRK